jgi:uncharacterized protein DUF6941
MARVDWAIACRHAEASTDRLLTIVGAGVDTLLVERLPARLAIVLAVRTLFNDDELDLEHQLVFKVYDPEMVELGEPITVRITPGPSAPSKAPGWESAVFVPLTLHVDVTRHATYTVHVIIDERGPKTLPIQIRPTR